MRGAQVSLLLNFTTYQMIFNALQQYFIWFIHEASFSLQLQSWVLMVFYLCGIQNVVRIYGKDF